MIDRHSKSWKFFDRLVPSTFILIRHPFIFLYLDILLRHMAWVVSGSSRCCQFVEVDDELPHFAVIKNTTSLIIVFFINEDE